MADLTPLRDMIAVLRYRPGWRFSLRTGSTWGAGGATAGDHVPSASAGPVLCWPGEPCWLVIDARVADSGTGELVLVQHMFSVPVRPGLPAAYWRRWLLDRILDVERHEACEYFTLDGARPFYPEHGPGADFYGIRDRTPEPLSADG
jgi:hypothetical protein